MVLFIKLRRIFRQAFRELSLFNLVLLAAVYTLLSWLLLTLAGEPALTSNHDFLYWLVVTASTVGYGDLSPTTVAGKYIVSLWVIPLGLSIFAMVVTKIGNSVIQVMKKSRMGLKTVSISDHILVIGWNQQRTHKLLDILLNENTRTDSDILLCVDEPIENPMPGKIHFVHVDSYCHEKTMARTNISEAKSIIIDTAQDDVTLTTALFCRTANPGCHKTAYFQDESISNLLKGCCPGVECVPSVSLEMLAKATTDPGSSQLHRDLLDPSIGMTQYSCIYDGRHGEIQIQKLFTHLKQQRNTTLIGIHTDDSDRIDINPELNKSINTGARLHYIAVNRLSHQEIFNDAGIL